MTPYKQRDWCWGKMKKSTLGDKRGILPANLEKMRNTVQKEKIGQTAGGKLWADGLLRPSRLAGITKGNRRGREG